MPRKRTPSAARQRLADENAERLSAAKERARKWRAKRGRSVEVPETANAAEKFADAKLALIETRENIDEQWIIREACNLYQRAMSDIRPALHPKHRTVMRNADGEPLFTFQGALAARCLEIIGRCRSVAAFEEHVAVTDQAATVAILQSGRDRVKKLRGGEAMDADFDVFEAERQLPKPHVSTAPAAQERAENSCDKRKR